MSRRKESTVIGVSIVIVLTLIMAVTYSLTQNTALLIGLLGTYIGITISLLFNNLDRMKQMEEVIPITRNIIKNRRLLQFYEYTIDKLLCTLNYCDTVYEDLLTDTLDNFRRRLSKASEGIFEFRGESWRKYWKSLLSSKDIRFYHSVALVKSKNYWQDKPGREATDFNKRRAAQLPTKRIFVVWDDIWKNRKVQDWIIDQKNAGIEVLVVRKGEISTEEDVFHDIGIYGDKAVGYQFFDKDCRTIKFELYFDRETYNQTVERFAKLAVYATKPATEEYLRQKNTHLSKQEGRENV